MKFLYIITLTVMLASCGETQEDKAVAQKVQALKQEVLTQTPKAKIEQSKDDTIVIKNETNTTKKENALMKKIGFSSKDGTISLDTNKAKGYLQKLGADIKDKSKELSQNIKEKTITVTKDVGGKLENMAKDVDTFARKVINDKNTTR